MTTLDYALILIVAGSAAVGLFRGLFREAMSLAAWVVAVWAAGRYSDWLVPYMARWIESPVLDLWAARLVVLIGVLLLGGILTWLVSMALHAGRLGGPDRAAGMAFGVARGVLLAGVVQVVLRVAGLDHEPWWQGSKLVPYATPVADALREAAEHGLDRPGSPSTPRPGDRLPGRIGT